LRIGVPPPVCSKTVYGRDADDFQENHRNIRPFIQKVQNYSNGRPN